MIVKWEINRLKFWQLSMREIGAGWDLFKWSIIKTEAGNEIESAIRWRRPSLVVFEAQALKANRLQCLLRTIFFAFQTTFLLLRSRHVKQVIFHVAICKYKYSQSDCRQQSLALSRKLLDSAWTFFALELTGCLRNEIQKFPGMKFRNLRFIIDTYRMSFRPIHRRNLFRRYRRVRAQCNYHHRTPKIRLDTTARPWSAAASPCALCSSTCSSSPHLSNRRSASRCRSRDRRGIGWLEDPGKMTERGGDVRVKLGFCGREVADKI